MLQRRKARRRWKRWPAVWGGECPKALRTGSPKPPRAWSRAPILQRADHQTEAERKPYEGKSQGANPGASIDEEGVLDVGPDSILATMALCIVLPPGHTAGGTQGRRRMLGVLDFHLTRTGVHRIRKLKIRVVLSRRLFPSGAGRCHRLGRRREASRNAHTTTCNRAGDWFRWITLRRCVKSGQVPLPQRPAACFAQRYPTPFTQPLRREEETHAN
jgi:hypothetical protein